MAKKKAASPRKSPKPPPPKPLTLKSLSEGQKQINGRLYTALELVIDFLRGTGGEEALREAERIIDQIPAIDPPGCEPPPY
jgi:NAD(P)H-hydrate repair Nnr-like enzyme with NAD(P)H-hydrate epimerase domain